MMQNRAKVQAVQAFADGKAPGDVMISYDLEDKGKVSKLRDKLKQADVSAWMVDTDIVAGANIFNEIGRIVVDCKVFLFAMTVESVSSKLCQDQLALAYISSKMIFPVAMAPRDELLENMDNGMKLQLAGFEWHNVINVDNDSDTLVENVKAALKEKEEERKEKDKATAQAPPKVLVRQKTRTQLNKSVGGRSKPGPDSSYFHLVDGLTYWQKSFKDAKQVPWQEFRKNLLKDYQDDFKATFGEEDTDWLISILHREMMVESDEILHKEAYLDFCTIEGNVLPLWLRIQDQARESYAMLGVFNIDSSVRLQAIDNLGKFRSATVIDALNDLMSDKDPNIVAVAIISLARTEANDVNTTVNLQKCLRYKDRVVREAACLALGRMKATVAVDKLVDLWRNDIISNVREAALVALKNIGGEKADEAIRVLTVLEKEIRVLKTV